MMVNASAYKIVHSSLAGTIDRELDNIKNAVQLNYKMDPDKAYKDKHINDLYIEWMEEYSETEFSWQTIQSHLWNAIEPISVLTINSTSASKLDYNDDEPKHLIAVGGYVLSRGLTLEGLLISYFLRNSQMSDTLMQMGRWFGYRDHYEDICRVWMTQNSMEWYSYIAGSTRLLMDEIILMEKAKKTPKEFGLKIRNHPSTLMITARNKMGSAAKVKTKVDLSEKFIETHRLNKDKSSRDKNLYAVKEIASFLNANSAHEKINNSYLFRDISSTEILKFLRSFQYHEGWLPTFPTVNTHIRDRIPNELDYWDVCFFSTGPKNKGLIYDGLGFAIHCQRRTIIPGDDISIGGRNQKVSGNDSVQKIGLTEDDLKRADEIQKDTLKDNGKNIGIGLAYRRARSKPLLLIHLLELVSEDTSEKKILYTDPVAAWSISWPATEINKESDVEFFVNKVYVQNENNKEDEDEDDEDEDEDDDE